MSEAVPFYQTRLTGGFWKHYQDLVREVTEPAVYRQFAESGRFQALKCSWKPGDAKMPHIYWDSDTAKWLEGAAYLLKLQPDPELESKADAMIADIAANQREDGYFNSYFLSCDPAGIWQDRTSHELYCIGHLIEAAIAYKEATGKDLLLKVMLRAVDCVERVFVKEKSAGFFTPGHEEIELALCRLYEHTGEKRFLDLALYFLNERAKHKEKTHPLIEPEDPGFEKHPRGPVFSQSNTPVRELKEAEGHCVRAAYLYIAMAMAAEKTGDAELKAACGRLYEDITERKLSVTGGIGAYIYTEGFGKPYLLENRTGYNETCAAIALAIFAEKMRGFEEDSKYGDLIERILYNGMLSGLSLSGDAFFYENALEIDLREYTECRGLTRPQAEAVDLNCDRRLQRAKLFTCSCCPPNILRILASVSRFQYRQEGNRIYCEQFADSVTEFSVNGVRGELRLKTAYPADGKLCFSWKGPAVQLAVRIPEWCAEYTGVTEKGYAFFDLKEGETTEVELPMEVHYVEARPEVAADCGRIAVQRGPVVYCLEGVDNGADLRDIELDGAAEVKVLYAEEFPAPVLEVRAFKRARGGKLYRIRTGKREAFTARLIPYFCFANRGESDMLVWTAVR